MSIPIDPVDTGLGQPAIRRIAPARPFAWLAAAWRDLRANPLPSLAYGLLFGLGGDLIIIAALEHPHLVSVAVSGFFLVAPLLAAGLYELSRARAQGEHLLFVDSLRCFRRNSRSLALFGLLLALITLLWERLSAIAFSMLGMHGGGSALPYLQSLAGSGEHTGFLLTWVALGGLLALYVFALAVVAVPLMLDRDADVPTAIATSLRAFAANPGPLLLWAAIIVVLTLAGFATLLFGMVLIMPLLGHASWHAYRELVE